MTTSPETTARRRGIAFWWAILGIAAVFVEAIVQLGRRGYTTMTSGLEPLEWVALAILSAAFVYGEGMRALERRWVPGVIARAHTLDRASALNRWLAPLYAMSLVGAPRVVLARAWVGVALIVLAVLVVRALPEPWRGIVDTAVALALLWGLIAIVRQSTVDRRP